MRQSPLELELERIVVGGGHVGHKLGTCIVRIRRRYECRLYKPSACCSDVRNGRTLLPTQSLPDRDIPLQRVGQLEIWVKSRHRSGPSARLCDWRWRGIGRTQRECGRATTTRAADVAIGCIEGEAQIKKITNLRCRQVEKDAKSTTKHSLPVLILRELVGNAEPRRNVPVLGVIRRRAYGRQSKSRQIV